jgi:hypothetical protein
MKKLSYNMFLSSLIIFTGALVLSCATKSYINVDYRLPLSSYDLEGKKIFLEIKDMRSVKTIFSEKAKRKFKHFTGLFLFSLSQGEQKDYVVGAFDLPSLFKIAFKRRLENLGVVILKEPVTTEPVIEIDLQKFFLDMVDRKWVAQISYDARLIKDNKLVARETVSGDAQRYKFLPQGDVEKVLGEIFTSLVNTLDFQKLFQRAALSS